jgi:Uma2 family endonuclease
MALLIQESWLPATITHPAMSDAQFAALCGEHPDLFFEMTAEGDLLVMPPTHTVTGLRNMEVGLQLALWNRKDRRGYCTEAASGFVLPNGARRSPDAAWTEKSRVARLTPDLQAGFWHLCPNFVIELRSDTDRLPTLRSKMHEWIANGAELAWLIDPERRVVEVFRPGREPEILAGIDRISGEGPVDGFVLELGPVWRPLDT